MAERLSWLTQVSPVQTNHRQDKPSRQDDAYEVSASSRSGNNASRP